MTSTDLGVLGQARARPAAHARDRPSIAVLMVALIVNLTWIQVVDARDAAATSAANTRNLAAEARSDRGAILTRDGVVLAAVRARRQRHATSASIPRARFAAHTVGYFSPRYGRAGIEAAENDVLAGGERTFATLGRRDRRGRGPLGARQRRACSRIDSKVQAAAIKALGGRARRVRRARPAHGCGARDGGQPRLRPQRHRRRLGRSCRRRRRRPARRPRALARSTRRARRSRS